MSAIYNNQNTNQGSNKGWFSPKLNQCHKDHVFAAQKNELQRKWNVRWIFSLWIVISLFGFKVEFVLYSTEKNWVVTEEAEKW